MVSPAATGVPVPWVTSQTFSPCVPCGTQLAAFGSGMVFVMPASVGFGVGVVVGADGTTFTPIQLPTVWANAASAWATPSSPAMVVIIGPSTSALAGFWLI